MFASSLFIFFFSVKNFNLKTQRSHCAINISTINFRFQVFFAKILAHFSAVSNLKISWKSVRKCELSRKSVPENGSEIENRKSKIADRIFENSSGPSFGTDIYQNYSLGAPVSVLHGFPAKFLQKIEWKKVACRCMAIFRNRNFISYFA